VPLVGFPSRPGPPIALNGLSFPRNSEFTEAAPYIFQLTGANVFTPGYPATYVWRYQPRSPNNGGDRSGYYTTFFYGDSRIGQGFDSGNGYYGFHPYPNPAPNGSAANWEISTSAIDDIIDENGNSTVLVADQWYTQAATVRLVNTNELEFSFYWNLGVGTDRIIQFTSSGFAWANAFPPPFPGISFGDACWSVSQERMNGILGAVKIFNALLSLSDIQTEAANMAAIATAAGASNRWWFKATYETVDDLTDAVTGKSAAWADASFKATLVGI
jgi:hypothetical protein